MVEETKKIETIEIVEINYKNYIHSTSELRSGKKIEYICAIVPVKEIIKFSNDPNVREIDKKAKSINRIMETLGSEPGFMEVKNLGVSVTASNIRYNDSEHKIILDILKNNSNNKYIDGIINGGHTWYAINQAINNKFNIEKAYVKLNIYNSGELDKEDIIDISIALNDSVSPKDSTLVNHSGALDNIKNNINLKYVDKIEWKQNSKLESKEKYLSLNDFIMMLNCFDKSYDRDPTEDNSPSEIYKMKSIKAVSKQIMDGISNYDYLIPIINDIINLYDRITKDTYKFLYSSNKRIKIAGIDKFFEEKNIMSKTLFNEEENAIDIQSGLYRIILWAFRKNTKINSDNKIEWIVPLDKLYDKSIRNIWETMYDMTKGNVSVNGKINISNVTRSNPALYMAIEGKVRQNISDMKI